MKNEILDKTGYKYLDIVKRTPTINVRYTKR